MRIEKGWVINSHHIAGLDSVGSKSRIFSRVGGRLTGDCIFINHGLLANFSPAPYICMLLDANAPSSAMLPIYADLFVVSGSSLVRQ